MFRLLAMAAALFVAGCVTPLTVEQQSPAVQYQVPGRTLVAVVDSRERVAQGKATNFLGFARIYGVPTDWTVETLMFGTPEDKTKTMAELLASRVVTGVNGGGGSAEAVALSEVQSDAGAQGLLQERGASSLMTLLVRNWHFDLNTSWVGRFRFETDMDVIVQRVGAGTVLRKAFAENQAIEAEGENSWGNMLLDAYRDKLAQTLNDPEVRAALTAPAASAPEPAAAATAPVS
jgi:hypothetical protein